MCFWLLCRGSNVINSTGKVLESKEEACALLHAHLLSYRWERGTGKGLPDVSTWKIRMEPLERP